MTEKEKYVIRIIAIAVIITIIGVSFAYFMAQTKDEANVDVDMISDKLDNLTYVVDKDINLFVNQFNLASGEDNVTDTSTATVSSIANQTSKSAEAYYNIYFYIESNPYIYTTEDKKPEIILNINDVNNNEVTSIEGLDYVSAENANGTTINGFDITEKAGLYTVSLNTKITSNSSITATKQTWKVKLTFVNLTSNQVANEDKKLTARMILNDKVYKKISEVCQSGDNLANCIINFYNANETIATNIYHHDGTLENGINDESYRYAGPSNAVNNFVCFGSNISPCPEDNLYRIIGVIDGKVKLIKSISIENMKWENDVNKINTWATSSLNTYLNTTFLNNIANQWSNKIAVTQWQVGGNNLDKIILVRPSEVYQNEIVNPAISIIHEAKIGLIYVSDYAYSAIPINWFSILYNYNSTSQLKLNWLYSSTFEWLITRNSTDTRIAFHLSITSIARNDIRNPYAIRPTFSLISSTNYKSGNGTQNDPIIIE